MPVKIKNNHSLLMYVLLLVFLGLGWSLRQEVMMVFSQRLVPIYRVETPTKKVAITIDGVWGAELTPRILNILKQHDISITFFFGGYWLEKYSQMAKMIAEAGHEIENHTYSHPHCSQLSPQELSQELKQCKQLILSITGREPQFFRPPFGDYNNIVIQVAEDEGYKVIQWSIDSLDWKNPGPDFIVRRVMENIGPGEIILMHNNAPDTPSALEILLPRLKSEGYQVVPLSELVYEKDYIVEKHSGTQRPISRD